MSKKIIIFYYEWPNTAGNHAGMAYFVRCLKRDLGFPVKLIRVPREYSNYPNRVQLLWRHIVIQYAKLNLNPDDVFFLMEYLGGRHPGDHRAIALELRAQGIKNSIIGLVHLPFKALFDLYGQEYIRSSLDAVDKIIVFGSSLAKDFSTIGYEKKILQTFHYVDAEYYHPIEKKRNSNNFSVIVMGFLYRNRLILKEIIGRCENVRFELCLGRNEELHTMFSVYPNAVLNGFLSENELVSKMNQSDASLSVMDDTIGSNVITTSLACGLPQVVSNVGSIRDYCSEQNSIFCDDVEGFVSAISVLKKNPILCEEMRYHARKKAELISLENSIIWYRRMFTAQV